MRKFVALTLIGALLGSPSGVFAQEGALTTAVSGTAPRPGFLREAIARAATREAQTLAQADYWAAIQGLPAGSLVEVTLTTGQHVTGTLVEVDSDAVVLQVRENQRRFLRSALVYADAVSPPEHLRIGRLAGLGALIGAGAGAFLTLQSSPCTTQSSGGECGLYLLLGAGWGAGIGAGVGALVGVIRNGLRKVP